MWMLSIVTESGLAVFFVWPSQNSSSCEFCFGKQIIKEHCLVKFLTSAQIKATMTPLKFSYRLCPASKRGVKPL